MFNEHLKRVAKYRDTLLGKPTENCQRYRIRKLGASIKLFTYDDKLSRINRVLSCKFIVYFVKTSYTYPKVVAGNMFSDFFVPLHFNRRRRNYKRCRWFNWLFEFPALGTNIIHNWVFRILCHTLLMLKEQASRTLKVNWFTSVFGATTYTSKSLIFLQLLVQYWKRNWLWIWYFLLDLQGYLLDYYRFPFVSFLIFDLWVLEPASQRSFRAPSHRQVYHLDVN